MRQPVVLFAAMLIAAGVTISAGCVENSRHVATSDQAIKKLSQDNLRLRAKLAERDRQIDTLQKLGDKRLDELFYVKRISLGRHTGAVDLDGKEGIDGIKVYLKPIDQDGSVIKAAGSVTVQLFDLASKKDSNLIATHNFSTEQVAKTWSSGFLAYHYSLECPWRDAPPEGNHITVRVTFTEYLTGKSFTAQKLCDVSPRK